MPSSRRERNSLWICRQRDRALNSPHDNKCTGLDHNTTGPAQSLAFRRNTLEHRNISDWNNLCIRSRSSTQDAHSDLHCNEFNKTGQQPVNSCLAACISISVYTQRARHDHPIRQKVPWENQWKKKPSSSGVSK